MTIATPIPPIQSALGNPAQTTDFYRPASDLADAFFAQALQSGSLAHGYILKGRHADELYALALKIAQVLSCENPPAPPEGALLTLASLACGACTPCRWVRDNSHPNVLTVSRLTYLVGEKGSDLSVDELEKLNKKGSSTQIKAEQIDRLLSQLALSSTQPRIVIFTDAEERGADYPSGVPAPFEWRSLESNAEKSFHVLPLERHLFNAASANRFLKTLEEPPPRTIFFFLAETEEQLLETIVSRCQVVPCLGAASSNESLSLLKDEDHAFLSSFLSRCQSRQEAYALAEAFENYFVRERGQSLCQALESLQSVLRSTVSLQDEATFRQYRRRLQQLETSRRRLDARVNESAVLLDFVLSFTM
jgi:hypothetical protein